MATETEIECAAALRCIANDLRTAGDIPLVMLSDDGVDQAVITLADELWLIALRLDGRLNNDEPITADPTPQTDTDGGTDDD